MFVSNSDNLGATMDLTILSYFANSGAPFMMEVADRTEADKKGGHLARKKTTGMLLLRESVQCPERDEKAFQDTTKYKYFNTNNLWVDLRALKVLFEQNGGSVPLPVMKNSKTVDPRDKLSTKILQLETAMGAAIECFPGAIALVIPRSRFAPVKTTSDLFALRSDAYILTKDHRVVLHPDRQSVPPNVKLDSRFKFADAMQQLIPHGPPSLLGCRELTVEGNLSFSEGVVIKGKVTVQNTGSGHQWVPPGTYSDQTIDLAARIQEESLLAKQGSGNARQQAQEAAQRARDAACLARQLANGTPTPTKKQKEESRQTPSDSEISTSEETSEGSSGSQGNDQPATDVAYAVKTLPSIDVEIVKRLETFFGTGVLAAKAEEIVSKGVPQADLDKLLGCCHRLQFFRVCVPKPYPGVQYRKTKHVDDRYQRYAEDGAVLVGQAEDDGQWLKISTNVFVPMFVGQIRVLKPVLRPEETTDRSRSDGTQSTPSGKHGWKTFHKAAKEGKREKSGKRRQGDKGCKKDNDCCVQ